MSHSVMIYFTLHPVQFKATKSKKGDGHKTYFTIGHGFPIILQVFQ